jgi:3',5'-cyclic AMP phosphodiesterase CpdA
MPIYLPPISRRRFLNGSLAAGVGLTAAPSLFAAEDKSGADPNRIALLSDVHIAGDAGTVARNINRAEHMKQACAAIAALSPRPAHMLINGDFAFNEGFAADYATAVGLLSPVREAGIPVHVGLGNHDHRERFWAGVPEEHKPDAPLKDKHVALIETERANWLMLDSLDVTLQVRGKVGEEQLAWLGKTLDAHADKPALVMVHHNPENPEKPGGGVEDTAVLLDVLSPRKQAKALIFGHTHKWSQEKREDGLHLINLPANAYVFSPEQPSGWVDVHLGKSGATMQLNTLDPGHPWSGQKVPLRWRK